MKDIQFSNWRNPDTGSPIPGASHIRAILLSRPDFYELMREAVEESTLPLHDTPATDELMEALGFPECPERRDILGGIKEMIWDGCLPETATWKKLN